MVEQVRHTSVEGRRHNNKQTELFSYTDSRRYDDGSKTTLEQETHYASRRHHRRQYRVQEMDHS